MESVVTQGRVGGEGSPKSALCDVPSVNLAKSKESLPNSGYGSHSIGQKLQL